MTSPDIPERLEWRLMLPVSVLAIEPDGVQCIVSYNGTGLAVAKKVIPDGVKRFVLQRQPGQAWFADTEDLFVEFKGAYHGSGRFYGYDRKTKKIRSLYHDMKALGYAVEDDE